MLLKRFKEDKEIMEIEMRAADKMAAKAIDLAAKSIDLAETATSQFIEKIKSHVKYASKEDILEFLNTKDETIEKMDKLAVAALYAEEHDTGIVAIGTM